MIEYPTEKGPCFIIHLLSSYTWCLELMSFHDDYIWWILKRKNGYILGLQENSIFKLRHKTSRFLWYMTQGCWRFYTFMLCCLRDRFLQQDFLKCVQYMWRDPWKMFSYIFNSHCFLFQVDSSFLSLLDGHVPKEILLRALTLLQNITNCLSEERRLATQPAFPAGSLFSLLYGKECAQKMKALVHHHDADVKEKVTMIPKF